MSSWGSDVSVYTCHSSYMSYADIRTVLRVDRSPSGNSNMLRLVLLVLLLGIHVLRVLQCIVIVIGQDCPCLRALKPASDMVWSLLITRTLYGCSEEFDPRPSFKPRPPSLSERP